MPAFLAKAQSEILRHALEKLGTTTPVTAVAPGSIARAMAEAFAFQLGDLYAIMDFNTSMSFISTATGRALDMFGSLYNIPRRTLTQFAATEETVGSFYFYLDSPSPGEITVPANTQVTTDAVNFVGEQYIYHTTQAARISTGRTKAWVPIRPSFTDSVFTAGANTLTKHSFVPPPGITVKCTNPKPIAAQLGYEEDNAYRVRLTKAVRTASGGTTEAMRFSALSVSGVRDVAIRTAPYGLGSFEVIVTPDNAQISTTVEVAVATVLNLTRPVGVRMFVRSPQYMPIETHGSVTVKTLTGVAKADIAKRAENGVIRYINTLMTGQNLVWTQMIQAILDSSELITDAQISSFRVNGSEVLRRNVTVEEDQQLIPGSTTMAFS